MFTRVLRGASLFAFSAIAVAAQAGYPPAAAPVVQTTPNAAAADPRVKMLTALLRSRGSPLAPQAETFVAAADAYGLDWRLLPAIAGMESNFGKEMLAKSYNPFGWGGGYIYFESFEAGIESVAREVYQRFEVEENGSPAPAVIGPSYCPPNYQNWIAGVNFFMAELERGGRGGI